MSIKLNDSIRVQGGKPVEDKRLNNGAVYTSVSQANALISKTDRYQTLEVAIRIGDVTFIYWYKEGIEDSDLVPKNNGSSNLTLEQVRQNGNVLEGDVEVTGDPFRLFNEQNILQLNIDGSGLEIISHDNLFNFGTNVGLIAGEEIDKQGYRKAFAQISDLQDYVNEQIEAIVIPDGNNVTNSSNTTNGSYAQVQRVGDTWSWDTNGQSYAIKNLPNKSADASYTDFVGKNSQGQLAKVGYPAINNLFSGLTPTEALTLSQLLAGGSGSTGAPNVNVISPPIIQNQYNTVEYVLLRGVNLKLDTTSMGIQIIASDRTTVVAVIPNNQIQLYDDGLSLVFYYNFYNFPVGTYFVKVISGVKTYITTLDLKIVQEVENINLNNITWDWLYADGASPRANDLANGSNVRFDTPTGISTTPKVNLKSSELFAEGEDFYLELKIKMSSMLVNKNLNRSYIGIGYSSTANTALFNSLISYNYQMDGNYGGSGYVVGYLQNSSLPGLTMPIDINVIIIKTGNLFRIINDSRSVSETLSNNSGYSMFLNIVGEQSSNTVQVQILKAFKFN